METLETRTDAVPRQPALCVLASGSAGNCSVLATPAGLTLVDIGLSPRRTRRVLAQIGVDPDAISDVLLTHLDHDHLHNGWRRAMPGAWTLRMHRAHLGRARRAGLLHNRTEPFDCGGAIELPGATASAIRVAHDSLGVAAFRIEAGDRSIGFATDLGRVTDALIDHLAGVGLLAIESNYCPELQASSSRPAFLKRRITGGAGHLSNAQCAEATSRIAPRTVVLIHLSRECNEAIRATSAHGASRREVTVSSQHEPTAWIPAARGALPEVHVAREAQGSLFAS